MTVEFWTSGTGMPVANVRQALRAEDAGYDGITYVDSQNLAGDCYIALALAARATSTLKLGTGVTNSGTRDPAVTACASPPCKPKAEDGRTSASGEATPHWPISDGPRIA